MNFLCKVLTVFISLIKNKENVVKILFSSYRGFFLMGKFWKVYDIPGACSNFLDELNKFIIIKLKLKIKLNLKFIKFIEWK